MNRGSRWRMTGPVGYSNKTKKAGKKYYFEKMKKIKFIDAERIMAENLARRGVTSENYEEDIIQICGTWRLQ